jgi:thioesterase domain-containing protein
MNSPAELERFLHEKIPLTVAMGVHVAECNESRLILTAPLAPNRNHLHTAFGGSLHALATLSGYGMLWWLLGEPDAHIVIRESTIRYLHPVPADLTAICDAPPAASMERFRRNLARKGKARIHLPARIERGDESVVEFEGIFIALKS